MTSLFQTFAPIVSVSVNATTTATAAATLPGYPAVSGIDTVRLVNAGTAVAYIKFGADASVVADVATGVALLPGVIEVLDPPDTYKYFSVYAPSGTQSINITSGVGA